MESRNRKLEHVNSQQSYEADPETFARHNILCENNGLWTLPESFPQVWFSWLISGALNYAGLCRSVPVCAGPSKILFYLKISKILEKFALDSLDLSSEKGEPRTQRRFP